MWEKTIWIKRELSYQNQLVKLILGKIKNCVIDNLVSLRDTVEKAAYVQPSRNNRQQDPG